MSNQIEICNLALSRLGKNRIQSINDATVEAEACLLHWQFASNAVLADLDWNFARKLLALALVTDVVGRWKYCYFYPNDCIAARRIYNPWADEESLSEPLDEIPFEVYLSVTTGNNKIIATDMAQASLYYTAQVQNTNLYSPGFCDALAWRLGAEMAQLLRNDAQLGQTMKQNYTVSLSGARAQNANEQKKRPTGRSSLLDAR